MLDGSNYFKAIPPMPASQAGTDFKVKHSTWVMFEGTRMSVVVRNYIQQLRHDVAAMRARRMGV